MSGIGERLKRSWNAFMGRDPTYTNSYGSSYRPDRIRLSVNSARSIVNSIYNRIAVDCAQIDIRHVKLDSTKERYSETIESTLNECLSINANIDQSGRALIQDVVTSMFDEGCVAIVPTEATRYSITGAICDILSIRVGKILEWYPDLVKVEVYNETIGRKVELMMRKKDVAIIENPFYSTMNESNSILQRLLRILNQLDAMNDMTSSGKMDLLIQVPYGITNDAKKEHAENRLRSIEQQLVYSKYGIAYIDGTEKPFQLNRSLENNLWNQANELSDRLYNQLGLTKEIFDGSADDKAMLNYYNRTIEPILSAITLEMNRKWISKTARSQGQSIMFFRNPFKLVPVNDLAEIGDKFTRNEIMTSNEIRSVMGMKPSKDPKADQLINSNINHKNEDEIQNEPKNEIPEENTDDANVE